MKEQGVQLKTGSTMEYVALGLMQCREEGKGQRALRESWADKLLSEFELEKVGKPVLNKVGKVYWVVDGMHRRSALIKWLQPTTPNWEAQQIECVVFHGLSVQEEADMFLALNNRMAVKALTKFMNALTAGHEEETKINDVIVSRGLKLSPLRDQDCVSCVTKLIAIYRKGGEKVLGRTLTISTEAFGVAGADADIVQGIGQLVKRYETQLDDKRAIFALLNMKGGANALRARAARLRVTTGLQPAHCLAAAAVEIVNKSITDRKKKLPDWWKSAAG